MVRHGCEELATLGKLGLRSNDTSREVQDKSSMLQIDLRAIRRRSESLKERLQNEIYLVSPSQWKAKNGINRTPGIQPRSLAIQLYSGPDGRGISTRQQQFAVNRGYRSDIYSYNFPVRTLWDELLPVQLRWWPPRLEDFQ